MKKALISLIISISLISSALAFSDVAQNAWFAPYVTNLQEVGIIDAEEFFRPADGLNRAELVKMVIEATSGIEDYEPPAYPTFDDVPKESWFSPYVEEATTLGIVSGYKDETGSLTGMFGPADVVSRAAATKILVEAFGMQAGSMEEGGFIDVQEDDWFHDYVGYAQDYGIISGYPNGNFGPADSVTRAQIAKMLSLAMGPPQETEEEKAEPEEEIMEESIVDETVGEVAVSNPELIVSTLTEAGSNEVLVGRYNFQANHEGFYITTITIVNDITGDNLGDDPNGTIAIKNIILKFPDENGFLSTAKRSLLSDGKARFSGLDFFAERDKNSFLEIYAELTDFTEAGKLLSGETFRLGIQNINNNTQTFRAVGGISGNEITFGTGSLSSSSSNIGLFTVRKSHPTFAIVKNSDDLLNGSNKLIEFKVSANDTGSVGLARMVFELNLNDSDSTGLTLSDFRFYRNGDMLDDVMIYDSTGGQDLRSNGGGSLADGIAHVIVSFDIEKTISSGNTDTFIMKANVSGSTSGDYVGTSFVDDDDYDELLGLTSEGNENTGRIFVNGDASAGIFSVSNDFSQTSGANKNIIWSDGSDPDSADWTNGYRLGLSRLDTVILSK